MYLTDDTALSFLNDGNGIRTDGSQEDFRIVAGRDLDGENGQLGFVDICDSPYPETVKASRTVGHAMYPFRHTETWTPPPDPP